MGNCVKRCCPICGSWSSSRLLKFEINFINESIFPHQFDCCQDCGFIFHSNITSEAVKRFYESNEDYLNEEAAGSGGSGPADLFRYEMYSEIIKKQDVTNRSIIVDVGCAKGGFVEFLNKTGFNNARGFELDPTLVSIAKNKGLEVTEGSIDFFPYESESVSCVTVFHVLEHLFAVTPSIKEIHRILEKGGYCLIEVPNAERYKDGHLFPHYWSTIKEHINHFDESSLAEIFIENGFKVKQVFKQTIPYHKTEFGYPSLLILFQKDLSAGKKTERIRFQTENLISEYFQYSNSRLDPIRRRISKWKGSQLPLVIWGCSLELQILSVFTEIAECNIVAIVDKNPTKQGRIVLGIKVEKPDVLIDFSQECLVIVCSVFHEKSIINDLNSIAPSLQSTPILKNEPNLFSD